MTLHHTTGRIVLSHADDTIERVKGKKVRIIMICACAPSFLIRHIRKKAATIVELHLFSFLLLLFFLLYHLYSKHVSNRYELMDHSEKQPNLRLKSIDKPLEKELTALSPTTPSGVAATLLSDSLFPPKKPKSPNAMEYDNDSDSESSDNGSSKKDPLATQVWRLYTKAKDTLPNASRMENLTWRMMAMTLNKHKNKSSAPSTPRSEKGDEHMDTTTESLDSSGHHVSSPPAPDDSTELLSSSAPPYMIDFLSGGPPFQRSSSPGIATPRQNRHPSQQYPRNKSVFVYGSTRATSSSSSAAAPSSPSHLASPQSVS